ncbi:hypothetical protein [Moorena sp. SIO3A2]|uniref:hypothetical protein n=1 Tax=Moorena sp. SIO3A2 TaxID=2607841 RepID=UPI0013BC5773|nr:hypothetical protein [Moorena sp. SIO3A2]NER90361.1 hypothetical protein [Moorena sp. SIO3A2]
MPLRPKSEQSIYIVSAQSYVSEVMYSWMKTKAKEMGLKGLSGLIRASICNDIHRINPQFAIKEDMPFYPELESETLSKEVSPEVKKLSQDLRGTLYAAFDDFSQSTANKVNEKMQNQIDDLSEQVEHLTEQVATLIKLLKDRAS